MDDVIANYRYCQYAEGFRAKRQVLPIDAIPESDAPIDYCTTYFSYGKDMFDYWMENNRPADMKANPSVDMSLLILIVMT